MASNHHCLCATRMATSFCLCERPKVCFLCDQCTDFHLSKQAEHAVCPINLVDIDHDLLSTRLQWCSLLQSLKGEVSAQWQQLSATVDSLRADHCRRVMEDYERAKSQVCALCEGVNECITRALQEMLDSENLLRGTLSKESRALVQHATHAEKRCSPLVRVHEEVSRALQGLDVSSVDTLAAQWGCSAAVCSTCSQQRVATSGRRPPAPRKRRSPYDRYWICETCDYGKNPVDTEVCQHCGSRELCPEPLDDSAAAEGWTCPCTNQRNTGGLCRFCGRSKAESHWGRVDRLWWTHQ